MTAITKSWVSIADGAVDPDSPVDTTLMTGIRDDLEHLREWMGASYYAGAVQNHSHDGVNSAMVPVGPNMLRNGSFEIGVGTDGWTLTPYRGGTIAINTASASSGVNCLAFTSTVLANGGGYATSDEYIAVTGGTYVQLLLAINASVAHISSKVEIIWYDNAKAVISASTLYTSTNTPTALSNQGATALAPSTSRFMRDKITGGVPATGTATGTVYFDGIVLGGAGGEGVTQAVGNNSTKLATTAFCENGFVNNDIGAMGIGCFAFGALVASSTAITAGSTYAGSSVYFSFYTNTSSYQNWGYVGVGSGTWRAIFGVAAPRGAAHSTTAFQRIS